MLQVQLRQLGLTAQGRGRGSVDGKPPRGTRRGIRGGGSLPKVAWQGSCCNWVSRAGMVDQGQAPPRRGLRGDRTQMKAGQSPCHLRLGPLPPGSLLQPSFMHSQNYPQSQPDPLLSKLKASISPHRHHPQNNRQTPGRMGMRPFSGSQSIQEKLAQGEENPWCSFLTPFASWA